MTISMRYVFCSAAVIGWLASGCSSSKKVDLGGGCLLNSDCNSPLSCSFGKCHVTCVETRDCPLGQSCVKTPEGGVCQLATEADCRTAPCASGLVCAVDYRCRKVCQAAALDCTAGQACAGGVCADSTDLDKTTGQLPVLNPAWSDGGIGSGNRDTGPSGDGAGGALGNLDGGSSNLGGAGGTGQPAGATGTRDASVSSTGGTGGLGTGGIGGRNQDAASAGGAGAGGTSPGGTGGIITRPDAATTPGVVWYVDQASAGGDGKSWSGAFTSLQSALTNSALRSGDQIWLAKGTYAPVASGGARTTYFYLVNGVALYGGFHGTEAKLADRDTPVDPSLTVLTGDISGDDGVDAKGVPSNRTDNSYHVVVGAGNAVVDGLTITGGNANGSTAEQQQGGGMYNLACDGLRISNVRFVSNLASGAGGGLYNAPSSYTKQELTNVIFVKNQAGSEGGGLYNGSGSTKLAEVTFANNTAIAGGGMSSADGDPLVTHAFFVANTAYSPGSGNGVDGRGGGLYVSGGNLRLTNAIFGGNSAVSARGAFTPNGWGGGFFVGNGSPVLVNVTFSGNTVTGWNGTGTGYGGGLSLNGGSPTLINVTVTGNATGNGGGVYRGGGTPKLTNVVLWGNGVDTTVSELAGTSISFSHSNIRGCGGSSSWTTGCGTDGGGNIDSTASPFAPYRAASGSWTEAPAYSSTRLQTTFTNALAPWVEGELLGMFIQPDTSKPLRLPIVANTSTSLTVAGDAATSAASGTMYALLNPRLDPGSGCVDTGDNAALPTDSGDVNRDGNTSEVIPWDLDDRPRVVSGTVDMGAYEY